MRIQWSEKVRTEHRGTWEPWVGARNHLVETPHGMVTVYEEDGDGERRPFAMISIIIGGRKYSSGYHKLKKRPKPTGVARMAGRFARLAAEEAAKR